MTAKEMFEASGYRVDKDDDKILAYERNDIFVVFEKESKTHYSFEYYHTYKLVVNCTISTHQAIHQQMKELGWIK